MFQISYVPNFCPQPYTAKSENDKTSLDNDLEDPCSEYPTNTKNAASLSKSNQIEAKKINFHQKVDQRAGQLSPCRM